ncbi:MAG: hypothetical protein KKE23_01525 [Nanoarchaeota archaeon]|nr:hypothetical protein [Nanoarchaeota archaeon]
MVNKKEVVYLVGDCGPEHNDILGVHKTYESALKAWDKLRIELLNDAKHMLQFTKDDARKNLEKGRYNGEDKPFSQDTIDYLKKIAENGNEIYLEIIEKLSCEDPEKIDNYPHETPYIHKEEIEE